MYQIISKDGQVSEPLDVQSLQNLALENKLDPQQLLLDSVTGLTLPAEEMLTGQIRFPIAPFSASTTAIAPVRSLPQPDSSLLGLRFLSLMIDYLCALPLIVLSFIPFVGIIFAPLTTLYFISRDSFFGGRSLGKKAMGLRVVRLDGKPVVWGTSVQRNISYFSHLIAAIPIIGSIYGTGLIGLVGIVEIVLVLATQLRIGDNISQTVVVRN